MSRELIDNIQPARVAAYQLQAALRDQETAVRGYVITADRQFLDPYYAGQRRRKASGATTSGERVGNRPELMADLDAIEQAAASWRAHVRRAAHRRRLAVAVPASPTSAPTERGKAEFDRICEHFSIARTSI